MKAKKFLAVCLVCLMTFLNCAYAKADNTGCIVEISGKTVHVVGQLPKSTGLYEITMIFTGNGEIVYMDQIKSNADSSFEKYFKLRDDVEGGTYDYVIKPDKGLPGYTGTIEVSDVSLYSSRLPIYTDSLSSYVGTVQMDEKILEADVVMTLDGYVPTLTGTIECLNGTVLNLSIKNLTDNTVIANEKITADMGAVNVSYTMPSLLLPKKYSINVTCQNEQGQYIVDINFTAESTTLYVALNGIARTDYNAKVSCEFKSIDTNLFDRNPMVTGYNRIDEKIPNIVPSTTYYLTFQGFEKVTKNFTEMESAVSRHEITANEDLMVYIKPKDIFSMKTKAIKVTYPADKLTLEDACVFTKDAETAEVVINEVGLAITDVTNNSVTYIVTDSMLGDYRFFGVFNGIKFKAKETGTAEITYEIIPR